MNGNSVSSGQSSSQSSSQSSGESGAASLRSVLEDVAAGRLGPEEAAAFLTGGPTPGAEASAGPSQPGAGAGQPAPLPVRVEILLDAVDLTVTADPNVQRVHVEGPLEVIERPDGVIDVRLPTRSPSGESYRFGAVGGLMAEWLNGRSMRSRIRIHPDVPLSVATSASKVEITGMKGGLNLRASASAVRFHDVAGPLALDLQSTSAKGGALLASGASTIRGTMSSLDLALLPGSDVSVALSCEMGSATIDGRAPVPQGLHESSAARVGAGAAALDVRMTMSAVKVTSP